MRCFRGSKQVPGDTTARLSCESDVAWQMDACGRPFSCSPAEKPAPARLEAERNPEELQRDHLLQYDVQYDVFSATEGKSGCVAG